jgi:hypothetical protein
LSQQTNESQVIHTTSCVIAHVVTGNTDGRLGSPAVLVARFQSRVRPPKFRQRIFTPCTGSPTARGSPMQATTPWDDIASRQRSWISALGIRPVSPRTFIASVLHPTRGTRGAIHRNRRDDPQPIATRGLAPRGGCRQRFGLNQVRDRGTLGKPATPGRPWTFSTSLDESRER